MSDVINHGAYNGPIGQEGAILPAFPYTSLPAPTGGFLTDEGGVTIGRFAWIKKDEPTVLTQDKTQALNPQQGGFIFRQAGAVLQGYDQGSGMTIPGGMAITALMRGTVYARATEDMTPGDVKVNADGTFTQGNEGTEMSPTWYCDRSVRAGEIFKLYA